MHSTQAEMRRHLHCFSATRMICAMLLLFLCAAAAFAEDPATIASIEFLADAPIDAEGLSRLLPMQVGDPFRAEDIEEGRRRLQLTELFTSIQIEPTLKPEGMAIGIFLTRKVVINAIRFRGYQTFSDAELRRAVRVQEGSPLSDAMRDYGVQRLTEYYGEQGFPAVQVYAHVITLSPGEANLTFEIEEGPPLVITSIAFTGDVPIEEAELRAAIPMKEGQRYSKTDAQAADKILRRFLRQHDFYEAEVESSWQLTETHTGTLAFEINAGPPFEVIFSGNEYFGEAAILELMDLLDRPIITDGTWRELARRARRAYQQAGFYEAKVHARVEPGSPRQILFEIDEGRRESIQEIRFEGNHGLSEEQLRAAMATRPPAWWPWNPGVLVDETLDEDLKRLWFLYRRYGYLDAQIVDARREIDDSGAIVVVVVIREGPQTLVGDVELAGLEALEILPERRTQPGQPLDDETIEADRRDLALALFKAGYATAEVEAKILPKDTGPTNHAIVRFEARPGDRHRVGLIVVQNNIDTRARVLLRELPFKEGDPLDPDALLAGQGNIYKLGLFRTVSVRPLAGESSQAREVAVNVSERFPGSLQWGFGYNTRDGFRGFGEVGYSNLRGLGRRVTLRGDFNFDPSQAQPDEYLGNLGFLDPRLFDSRWILRLNLIGQRATRAVDQFSIARLALVPAIERPLLPGLSIGFEMQIESARIFGVERDVSIFNPREEGDLVTVGVGPYVVYDGRDDPFQPTRGVYDSVRLKLAPAELGSDIPFFKIVLQHSHYVPLLENLTLVYALRAGWGHTLVSDDVLPIRERFFLGGRNTVRGFGENQIGPEGAPIYDEQGNLEAKGGHPLGGDLVVNTNTELRVPIAFGLGGAVFFDLGGVYLQERPIRVSDLRESSGVGLRYATPVGPIGLDYGFKLDRRDDEALGELHFSIGTTF